jgi:hypothetical protein
MARTLRSLYFRRPSASNSSSRLSTNLGGSQRTRSQVRPFFCIWRIQVNASAWTKSMRTLFRFALRLAISTAFSSRSTAVTSVAPARLGGDGEAARIAAQVEDLEAFGQGAETAAVVALVAEETGLVAFGEIDLLGHAELLDLHETDGRLRDVGRHDAFDAGHVRVDLDDLALGADGVVQDGDPAGQPAHDADRRDFDREDVAEAVDDQAGQKVGVGVDHAVGVGVGVELQDITAQGDRAAEGLLEPGRRRACPGSP